MTLLIIMLELYSFTPPVSYPASLGKRDHIAVSDHKVVKHPYLEKPERILKPSGNALICIARFGHP